MVWLEVDVPTWRERRREPVDLDPHGRPTSAAVIVRVDRSTAVGLDPSPGSDELGPVVLVAAASSAEIPEDLRAAADVVLVSADADEDAVLTTEPLRQARALAATIELNPVAAMTLAWLLRGEAWRDVGVGLVAESATYSMLLGSAEVLAWRRGAPSRSAPLPSERTKVAREGDLLRVTLTHGARRNAMDARMRDELVEALQPAVWDSQLAVLVDAEGPCFSSGGDTAEFLSAPDPARAHLVRTVASVGRLLAGLGPRVTVRVHGECIGAGVELPAFAQHVVAAEGSTFRLPEVAMGLVPGAGGTVSVPRRIGRRRSAWWMLSGASIDASTAHAWGLVDAIV